MKIPQLALCFRWSAADLRGTTNRRSGHAPKSRRPRR